MENRIEAALNKFASGYNCSQSVLYSFANEVKIDKEIALKIACGFGAGMGRKQEVCGAITGGIMAIGAKHGKGENDDKVATENTYSKTRFLIDRFRSKYGTCSCLELLDGCDLMTEKGKKYFAEKDLKNKICRNCVQDVVQILNEII